MSRTRRWPFRRLGSAVTLAFGAACSGAVADGDGPVAPPIDTTGGGGTVPRGSLTLTVTIDPEDAALAQAAGIGLQGLSVRMQRRGSAEAPQNLTTDASGTVRVDNLLTGTYDVAVDRPLSAVEVARLPVGDREASLLTGATSVPLTAPQGASAMLPLVATRRGSLVISEVYFLYNLPGTPYGFGTYLEVYNNADTTAYLDGLILFRSTPQQHNQLTFAETCDRPGALVRLDSSRVAVSIMHVFPGGGGEYPVPPGEARVLAMDAIDHRAASPDNGQVDLARAHFEEVASDGDTDNPLAVNLLRFTAGTGVLGRGYPWNPGRLYGLARATTATPFDLPVVPIPGLSFVSYGIPRAAVLDAIAIEIRPELAQATSTYAAGFRRCVPWIAPAFDRAPAFLGDYNRPDAIRRKTVGVTPDGRQILQRTRTSARDFEYSPPLLRSLRKGQ